MTSRTGYYMCRVRGSTVYLYPKEEIDQALSVTPFPYTFDGTNIVCPTINDLKEIYYAIWFRTKLASPDPNNPDAGGYTCNNGTLLQDMGEDMQFMLPDGEVVIKWRLVKQISPQTTPPVSTPGLSPVGTVGFVTTFCVYGANTSADSGGVLDPPSVIRLG
jgi:hypothetical protein